MRKDLIEALRKKDSHQVYTPFQRISRANSLRQVLIPKGAGTASVGVKIKDVIFNKGIFLDSADWTEKITAESTPHIVTVAESFIFGDKFLVTDEATIEEYSVGDTVKVQRYVGEPHAISYWVILVIYSI